MVRTRLLHFVVATAVVVAVLALPPLAAGANTGVSIAGFAFSPQSVTVHVGDTVTWSNSDAVRHTATADDGSFDTGPIANAASKVITFSTAGTFAYHCSIHPQMIGTIVVEAAAAPQTDAAMPASAPAASPLPGVPFLVLVFVAGLALADRRLSRAAREIRPSSD